jgi:hypothetical protein
VTNSFNQAPSVTLTSPTNGAVFQVPATMTLAALAADPDGALIRVEFFAGDISLGRATNAPYETVWTDAPVGTHALVAKARDNRLAVTVSAPVTITVEPPPLGNGIGLRGDYYDNMDFTGTRVRRIDPTVNFGWGDGQPDPGIGADSFSVRWTGSVQPRFSESYTFYTVSDDGIRLWVNNRLVIDNWTDHGDTENAGLIALEGGLLYDIRMEMYENGGGATAQLLWSSPSVAKEIIPSTQLHPPTSSNLPPVISLTSPTGGVFVAGATLNLAADALDPDGAIFKVEFFNGSSKLGETGVAPYVFPWTNVTAGQHTLRAVATDDSALTRTSAPVNLTVVAGFTSNVTLVTTGSVWRYRDTGEDLGAAWTAIGFNDAGWSSGPAQLGYGDGDERTIVGYGPNSGAKYITTYFRRSFLVGETADFTALNLRVLRDDGVIVYLNGSEVYRNNLPAGAVNDQTSASTAVGGADESTYYGVAINPGYLVPGTNLVAAEIHQSSGSSTDISFDFELTGIVSVIAPYVVIQPVSQSAVVGQNVTFSVGVEGTPPLAYQWRLNGAAMAGATAGTLTLLGVQLDQAGAYRVVVTNTAGSATSAEATLSVSEPDTDGDGLPDWWELANGTNPFYPDPDMDPDHDGLTNLQEFMAGTEPTNALSVLRLETVFLDRGADLRLGFTAVSNRSYTLQGCTNLANAAWQPLVTVPAQPTTRWWQATNRVDGPWRFYRLVTPAQP